MLNQQKQNRIGCPFVPMDIHWASEVTCQRKGVPLMSMLFHKTEMVSSRELDLIPLIGSLDLDGVWCRWSLLCYPFTRKPICFSQKGTSERQTMARLFRSGSFDRPAKETHRGTCTTCPTCPIVGVCRMPCDPFQAVAWHGEFCSKETRGFRNDQPCSLRQVRANPKERGSLREAHLQGLPP